MSYADASGLKWAVNTNVEVHMYWPDRTDCSGLIVLTCPGVKASVSALNPAVWSVLKTPGEAAEQLVTVTSLGSGDGGFSVVADGFQFKPNFVLTVDSSSAIWFERANGLAYGDGVVPGPINQLQIGIGQDAAVAVTLRNAAGEHLCGPVPATVGITGNVFSVDRFIDVDHVNLPYHIVAGNVPGTGSMQFTVGSVSAVLTIVVGP
jgi:hypothetical protein